MSQFRTRLSFWNSETQQRQRYDHQDDNPYSIPRFVIHGSGTFTDPFLVDSDNAPSSPCREARRRLIKRKLMGSQYGNIN